MQLLPSTKIKHVLVTLFAVCLLTPQVSSADAVTVVADRSTTAIQSTISAASDVVTAASTQALNIKEFTLDGIAYGITRTIIQSMVQTLINWINSGFEGSPAFVTDLKRHLQDIADQVVSDTLMGSDLAFLCSPFQLDVRVALATEFNNRSANGGFNPQCTLDDVANNVEGFLQGSFSEGGWQSWFELTQTEVNDPNAAFLDAQLEIDARIRNAQGEEIEILNWGDGFLSFKVCGDTQAQSGAQTNCTITTPGRVIADQLNGALGAGRDQLITADEINEVIGALLAQLAQQALTGVYGLLGLSEGTGFTDYGYSGGDGSTAFIDALEDEDPIDSSLSSTTRIAAIQFAIDTTDDYLATQDEIIVRIEAVQAERDSFVALVENDDDLTCSIPALPSSLSRSLADAEEEKERFELTLLVLNELRDRMASTTDPTEQSDIMEQFLELETTGNIPGTIDVTEAELFIQYDLQDDIAEYSNRLSSARSQCTRNGDGSDQR